MVSLHNGEERAKKEADTKSSSNELCVIELLTFFNGFIEEISIDGKSSWPMHAERITAENQRAKEASV